MTDLSSGCVFCGKTPTTLEHVFSPKWLKSLMPDATGLTTEITRPGQRRTYQQVPKKRERIWANGPAVNCACKTCNSTWMQAMDEGVKEMLTPLAEGELGTISAEGVRLLAIWATKIALVLDSTQNPHMLDRGIKHAFRVDPQPMSDATIWFGVMSPCDNSIRVRTSALGPAPGSDEVKGYVATFRVVHLVGQLCYPSPGLFIRSRFSKSLELLWPRDKELLWPPSPASWLEGEEEFDRIASDFEAYRRPVTPHQSLPPLRG